MNEEKRESYEALLRDVELARSNSADIHPGPSSHQAALTDGGVSSDTNFRDQLTMWDDVSLARR